MDNTLVVLLNTAETIVVSPSVILLWCLPSSTSVPLTTMNVQTIGLDMHYSQTSQDSCGNNLKFCFHNLYFRCFCQCCKDNKNTIKKKNIVKKSASHVTQAFYNITHLFTIHYTLFYRGTTRAKCDKLKSLPYFFFLFNRYLRVLTAPSDIQSMAAISLSS